MADPSILAPEDELTLQWLKRTQPALGPSQGPMAEGYAYLQGGAEQGATPVQTLGNRDLLSPHEVAAIRNRRRGGGQGINWRDVPDEDPRRYEQQYNVARGMGMIPSLASAGAPGLAAALVGGGIQGATTTLQGHPGEAAVDAASAALPFGIGKLGRFAAPAAGLLLAGQSTAAGEDKAPQNPYTFDEAAYQKRKLDAQKEAKKMRDNAAARYMSQFDEREGKARAEAQEKAAKWDEANQGKIQAANALDAYKKSVGPSAGVLKQSIQDQIKNATSIEEATKIYNDAMNEYTKNNQTFSERSPELMHMLQLGTAAAGGLGAGALAARRANRIAGDTKAAQAAWETAHGPGGQATPGNLNNLEMQKNILNRTSRLSPYSAPEMAIGTALPWVTGTGIPSAIDIAESEPGSPKNTKAWHNMADPWNMLRAGVEGFGGTVAGQFGGGLRHDIGGIKERARGVLDTLNGPIAQQAKMANALKTPRAPKAPPVATPMPPQAAPNIPVDPNVLPNSTKWMPGPSLVPGGQTGAGKMPEMLPDVPFAPETFKVTPEQLKKINERKKKP